ncbi:MAG: hypothetical protein HYS87_02425 [Candidatus Colwellbacteria bacterium]|nr:hypothetical protein [Candidatus Colwellbacteria bacterium]
MPKQELINLEPEKPSITKLKEAIFSSPEKIESELAKGGNDWLACFTTRVQVIEALFGSAINDLDESEDTRYKENIDSLKKHLEEVRGRYPVDEEDPPKYIKSELLGMLDILH